MLVLHDSSDYWSYLYEQLPGHELVYISTYGIKGMEFVTWDMHPVQRIIKRHDFRPTDFRIIVGIPYFQDCFPECPHCKIIKKEMRSGIVKNVKYLEEPPYNCKIAIANDFHMKMICTESFVVLGGRNFTGSNWDDLSIVVTKKNEIKTFIDIFMEDWDFHKYS